MIYKFNRKINNSVVIPNINYLDAYGNQIDLIELIKFYLPNFINIENYYNGDELILKFDSELSVDEKTILNNVVNEYMEKVGLTEIEYENKKFEDEYKKYVEYLESGDGVMIDMSTNLKNLLKYLKDKYSVISGDTSNLSFIENKIFEKWLIKPLSGCSISCEEKIYNRFNNIVEIIENKNKIDDIKNNICRYIDSIIEDNSQDFDYLKVSDFIKYKNDISRSGLDLHPSINSVEIVNGKPDLNPNETTDIVVNGDNYTPNSEIVIENGIINSKKYINSHKILLNITAPNNNGSYNVKVKNNLIESVVNDLSKIDVREKVFIDFRTADVGSLLIDKSNFVKLHQDSVKGLGFTTKKDNWNRGVRFNDLQWNRSGNVSIELIFTVDYSAEFCVGVCGTTIDIGNLTNGIYDTEISIHSHSSGFDTLFGGGVGDVNWSQDLNTWIGFESGKFYKLKFNNSGGNGSECFIYEVNPNDWDSETLLHEWISTNNANDELLAPCVIAKGNSGGYYLTGVKY